jgi:predicted RecA/RadA family phage recombinase
VRENGKTNMKNFVQEGKTLDFIAASDFEGGEFVKIGSAVGVVGADVATGEVGQLSVDGVFDVLKEAALAVAAFELLYIDAVNKRATKTASGNTKAGYATEAVLAASTTVKIKLVPSI